MFTLGAETLGENSEILRVTLPVAKIVTVFETTLFQFGNS